jgi:hypothetical protein
METLPLSSNPAGRNLRAATNRRLPAPTKSHSRMTKSQNQSQNKSQSYFTTGGLPPISSSWRKTSWRSQSKIVLQLNPCGHSAYVTSCLTRWWACLLCIGLAFVMCTYCTYSLLSKILPFALYTSPLLVQALHSRSFLSHLSYATTAT